jgi:predicted flap endonuclease-1-like 5' DNA nuclease
MVSIISIEGIGDVFAKALKGAGINTTEKLLEAGSTPKLRKDLAQQGGISETLVLKWVNRADLFRVKGIGEEYSDLLEAAGVDTVPELAQRNPGNLYEALETTNAQKKLVRQLPTRVQVESWVDQAKALPRVITY